MPALTPEIPITNPNLAEPAELKTPNYETGVGYGLITLSDGRSLRIPKSPLASEVILETNYEVPEVAPEPEESHSTTFERLVDLSHKVILYLENHIVHTKPQSESVTIPEPRQTARPKYEALEGYSQLVMPDGRIIKIEKSALPNK